MSLRWAGRPTKSEDGPEDSAQVWAGEAIAQSCYEEPQKDFPGGQHKQRTGGDSSRDEGRQRETQGRREHVRQGQRDQAIPPPLPPHQAVKLELYRVLKHNAQSVSHAATSGKPNGKENPCKCQYDAPALGERMGMGVGKKTA